MRHPDALFENRVADGKRPYWRLPLQRKFAKQLATLRCDSTVGKLIAGQFAARTLVMRDRVQFRNHQHALHRRA